MKGLTAELVVEGRVPQSPALAPNGHLLCYVLAPTSRIGDHLDTALWLADIEGDGVWRRATTDTATESRAFMASTSARRNRARTWRTVAAIRGHFARFGPEPGWGAK